MVFESAVKLRVMAMSRSGHHAVMHWICCQYEDITFFNNLHSPNPHSATVYKNGTIVNKYRSSTVLEDRNIMVSYEDCPPSFRDDSPWFRDDFTTILVVRDCYNYIASRLKAKQNAKATLSRDFIRSRLGMWKCYADMLGQKWSNNFIAINFNKWFSEIEYRKTISKHLNVAFSDRGLQRVSPEGGASSFDNKSYDGNAQQMDVLNRYKAYLDDEAFVCLFDSECRRLARKHFSIAPKIHLVP